MKKYLIALFVILLSMAQAQKHEIGVFVGGANGITDIGRSDYVYPLPKHGSNGVVVPYAVGALYRFNLNPQQSLRFQVSAAKIAGNDRSSAEDYRHYRGSSYVGNIYEASLLFEYNFFPINSEQKTAHSPYIFAGIGAFAHARSKYDVFYQFKRDESGNIIADATSFDYAIDRRNEMAFDFSVPFGLGYKYKFNWNFVVSAEVGVRATFVDNLDMTNVLKKDFTFHVEEGMLDPNHTPYFTEEKIIEKNEEIINSKNIGDNSSKDWYVFSGITFTYTFGRPPCFCD